MRRALTGDDHGTLRLIGGVLFGVGALVLLLRRTSFADPWGSGAVFAGLAIPGGLLYASGLTGARAHPRPTPWQSTHAVFGLILIPLSLFAFLDLVNGDLNSSWNAAWIFGLSALFAFAAAVGGRIRYAYLIGALELIFVWFSVWDELLSEGLGEHITTVRWLFVAIGLLLLMVAAWVAMRSSDESSSDIVTGAGIALVIAGGVTGLVAANLVSAPVPAGAVLGLAGLQSSWFWDTELLIVSLTLLAYGTSAAVRGPVYVGALGLAAFIGQVGLDLDDDSPSGHVVGWPLLLLILGAIALAISLAPALKRSG